MAMVSAIFFSVLDNVISLLLSVCGLCIKPCCSIVIPKDGAMPNQNGVGLHASVQRESCGSPPDRWRNKAK
jgi:hypothetical protein